MADIFVSYTSTDRDWAFWIGQQLEKLGHTPHLHDWEISAGGNIMAWMDERHDKADNVLCVISKRYLDQPYSALERQGAQWAAASKRSNFLWPVFVEVCEAPSLLGPLKRCDLHGLNEADASARLAAYLRPATQPSDPVPFPGNSSPANASVSTPSMSFPGRLLALSNIPVPVPRHFLGRDHELAAIRDALERCDGQAAIVALHGLRGVGKTTLTAAYADQHRELYRATWWIRAETETMTRADLVGLGVQMHWVASGAAEEPAVAEVLKRLSDDGERILLIYDNAVDPNRIDKFLPQGVGPHVIITSNAPNWSRLATPILIEVWSNETGANFLIARTGRVAERNAALALSGALGGLPLAHDQAAAYCERIGNSLAEYKKRFDAEPAILLDVVKDASRAYRDGLTVAKTFGLAINEAAKLHAAAEPLIVYASLLSAEPIPLYLFSEGRQEFCEGLARALDGDGLDEAVAALRSFALIDREQIPDERDPTITTDCVRLHRLVRQVAATRRDTDAQSIMRLQLIEAMAQVYPDGEIIRRPDVWPRLRRLDAIALPLVSEQDAVLDGAASAGTLILNQLGLYRQEVLAAYASARGLYEQGLSLRERALGPDHLATALSLNNLACLLQAQGDFAAARPYYERALAIREAVLGLDHLDTALSLNNLGFLFQEQGQSYEAQIYYERALAIYERVSKRDHPDAARCLSNLGAALEAQSDLAGARRYYEGALAIYEKELGPDHPETGWCLNNLGNLLGMQGDLAAARSYLERALTMLETALAADHPDIATSLNNIGALLRAESKLFEAQPYLERSLAIFENAFGPRHPSTANALGNLGYLLQAKGDLADARRLFERAQAILEETLGVNHHSIATSLSNLGRLCQQEGDFTGARDYYERALEVCKIASGATHPDTARALTNLGHLRLVQGDFAGARRNFDRAKKICEAALGSDHPETGASLNNLGYLLLVQGELKLARPNLERALDIYTKKFGDIHPDTRQVAQNLAHLFDRLGLMREATSLRKKHDLKSFS